MGGPAAYGHTLLVKLLVVAVAFGLGVYNSLVSRQRHSRRHLVSVGAEAALTVIAIFVAAVLTNLPPAATATDSAADGTALQWSSQAGGLDIVGQVRPARLGSNAFDVVVTDSGQPVRGLQIELSFQPAGGGALASSLEPVEAGNGGYMATGNSLTRAGAWQILVNVNRAGTLVYAPVDLDVGPDGVVRLAGEALPAPARLVGWLNRYGNALLAGLLVVLIAGWSWIAQRSLPLVKRVSV